MDQRLILVVDGNDVLSKIINLVVEIFFNSSLIQLMMLLRFGLFFLSIGVGNAIIIISINLKSIS